MTSDRLFLAIYSVVLVIGLSIITYISPGPLMQWHWYIYLVMLALAGGGFAAFLPGSIEWEVSPKFKATGALAVFLLVFWFGRNVDLSSGQIKSWALIPPPPGLPAPTPDVASVYVVIDGQIVKKSGSGSLSVANPKLGSSMKIERGPDNFVVDTPRSQAGKQIMFLVEDQSQWWVSDEILIPPNFPMHLRNLPFEAVKNRVNLDGQKVGERR